MKHLTDDERLAFIEGRAAAEVGAHLKECAECAAEVNAWQRSIEKLENFNWPARRERTRRFPFPALKLAAAAALAISVGVGIGRMSAPDASQIKAQVAAELRQELKRELAAQKPPANDRAVMALLTEIREQQSANYLQLRTDLETLAANADSRLQTTRRQLMELQFAANTRGEKVNIQ